jgi:collagen type III alpha
MEEARMTSEGHHAGQPPADATSGGPAEPFGDEGFPPDSEDRGRAPASGFPTSYAPPPHATPNGGSPFVVPTVFGQPGSPQPESAGSPPNRYGVPAAQPGQAPPADLADRTTPPPFPPPTAGSARVPGIGENAPLPQRTSGLPQRTPSSGSSTGSSGAAAPPPSAWAPAPAASATPADDPFGRPAEPHPYRADESDSGGFTGFAPGSPTRGRAGLDDADQPSSRYDRPATLGSFDQRSSDQRGFDERGTSADRPGSGSPFDRPASGAPYERANSGSPFEQPGSGSPFGRSTAGSPLDQPGSSFDQPGSSFDQPGASFDQRGSSFDQPRSAFDQPGSAFDQPGSPFTQSGSAFDQPGSAFNQSGSASEQSGAASGGLERSAPLGRPGSLPERPVSGDSGNGRPPGLSAFGDQRVRVPGATLTGLPDAPPPGHGGLPEAPTSGRGGLPETPISGRGGALPTRLPSGGQDGSDGGRAALPRRGQSAAADEPVFGSPRGDESASPFGAAPGSSFGGTPGSSSQGFPAHGADRDFPAQGFPAQAFPAEGFPGQGFSDRDRADQGFAASASVPPAPGQSPYGDEPSGDQPFRRPPTDVPDDQQQYARPPAGGSVFGRTADDSYGPADGESVFGRSTPGESPFGRSADEPFARPGNEAPSPFAPPPAGGSSFNGSAEPNGWPTSPTHDGPAAGRPDSSPFGGFEPGPATPDGDGFGGPRGNPDSRGNVPGASLFGGFVPRGSAGARSEEPSYGADSRDLGTPGSGGPSFGSNGSDSASPFGGPGGADSGTAFGSPGFDRPGSGGPGFGGPGSDGPGFGGPGSDGPGFGGPGSDGPGFGGPGSSGPDDGPGGASGGFAQRVPGASFAAAGPSANADPRNGAVPQPRDPADRPAVGSARAVSASASVPTNSRVAPSDAEEVPPPSAAPQARVYGRPAQPSDDDAERPEPPETAYPSSGGPASPPPPGRVAGRATASARVAPPGSDPVASSPPFSELTADVAGRGKPGGVQPGAPLPTDRYAENTSDISHRGPGLDQPYVPAPALPPMYARPPLENGFPPAPDTDQDRPRMGGLFPGPATRGTVTPPTPDQTSSWPGVEAQGPADDTEMARFDQFRPDAEAPPAKPETPHVRMLPVLISVIVGAALLVGLAFGIVWLISRGSDSNAGISVAAGDCVKRSGDEAVKAVCGDAGAFQVVSIADTKEQCADPGQPYVLNPTTNGKTQVLCLKPTS